MIEEALIGAIAKSGSVANLILAMAVFYLGIEIRGLKKSVENALPKIEDLRERVGVLEALRGQEHPR